MTCTFIRQPPFHINHYGQFQRWLSYTGFTVFWCWPISLFYKNGVWTGCVRGPFRSSRINFVINNFIWCQKRLFWIPCSQLALVQIKVRTVCLNYRKFRGKWKSCSHSGPFFCAYTQRQSTHQCCQCLDLTLRSLVTLSCIVTVLL